MAKSEQSTGELKTLEAARDNVKAHIAARAARKADANPQEASQLAEIEARISELSKPATK